MKEKKSATPITWEELERKAQSKLAPYFEIRSDSGDLLVCAQHEKAPECNFKTNDIGEAINAIADEGLHKFVFIRFMSTPSARTSEQKSQAMAGAMKAEILATTNQQILQVQREALEKEYASKSQMLEEKSKQELLDRARNDKQGFYRNYSRNARGENNNNGISRPT